LLWPRGGTASETLKLPRQTWVAARRAGEAADARLVDLAGIAAERWRAQLGHYLPPIERILAQSQRRVLDGQVIVRPK
jgi:IS5 family transposase